MIIHLYELIVVTFFFNAKFDLMKLSNVKQLSSCCTLCLKTHGKTSPQLNTPKLTELQSLTFKTYKRRNIVHKVLCCNHHTDRPCPKTISLVCKVKALLALCNQLDSVVPRVWLWFAVQYASAVKTNLSHNQREDCHLVCPMNCALYQGVSRVVCATLNPTK